jgi:hypothetical protein
VSGARANNAVVAATNLRTSKFLKVRCTTVRHVGQRGVKHEAKHREQSEWPHGVSIVGIRTRSSKGSMHTKHSGTATGKSARGAAEDAEGAEDAEDEDAEEDAEGAEDAEDEDAEGAEDAEEDEDAEGAEDAEAEAEDAEEDEEEDDDGRVGGTRVYRIPPKHCSSVSVSR